MLGEKRWLSSKATGMKLRRKVKVISMEEMVSGSACDIDEMLFFKVFHNPYLPGLHLLLDLLSG